LTQRASFTELNALALLWWWWWDSMRIVKAELLLVLVFFKTGRPAITCSSVGPSV